MISINLVLPGNKFKKVQIHNSLPVQKLEQFYPEIKSAYICHDQKIIMPSFSFSFLNIKDGDNVFIISHEIKHELIPRPKAKINNKVSAELAKMQGFSPNIPLNLVLEGTRLKDLRLTRQEASFTGNFRNWDESLFLLVYLLCKLYK